MALWWGIFVLVVDNVRNNDVGIVDGIVSGIANFEGSEKCSGYSRVLVVNCTRLVSS